MNLSENAFKQLAATRERRNSHIQTAENIVKKAEIENRNLTDDERKDFDGLMAKADGLQSDIARIEKLASCDTRSQADLQFEWLNNEQRKAAERGATGERITTKVWNGAQIAAGLTQKETEISLPVIGKMYGAKERMLPRPSGLSLQKLLRGAITGKWDGCELERKAMDSNVGSSGAVLVPEVLSAEIIDAARAIATATQAGAIVFAMPSGNVTMARVTQDFVPEWHAQLSPLTAQDMTLEGVAMTARLMAIYGVMSIELLEDAIGGNQVIMNALAGSMAAGLDSAIYRGTGADNQPTGLEIYTGLNEIDMEGSPFSNHDPFSQAVEAVLASNGPEAGLAAVYSPSVWGALDRLKEGGTNAPLQPPKSFENLAKFTSAQLPDPTIASPSLNSFALVGDFSQVRIGVRTDLTIEFSRVAGDNFKNLSVAFRAYARYDVMVQRPAFLTRIINIGAEVMA